jgi:hypothetical protein
MRSLEGGFYLKGWPPRYSGQCGCVHRRRRNFGCRFAQARHLFIVLAVVAFKGRQPFLVIPDNDPDVSSEPPDLLLRLDLHGCNQFDGLRERFESFVYRHSFPPMTPAFPTRFYRYCGAPAFSAFPGMPDATSTATNLPRSIS